ncbi:MAG: TRAP transporter large permease subunit, partial [Planctomycetota bacterium]
LGILIPPSIMLIIMADRLRLSVGDLFLGAIGPGIALAALYAAFIVCCAIFRPSSAPSASKDSDGESPLQVASLLYAIVPTLGLILLVLGSIFWGIATPTEASALGAIGALGLAALNGQAKLAVVQEALEETMNTMGFLFAIFIGATCFSLVLRLLGGDDLIADAVQTWQATNYIKVGAILFVVFLLGFFLEWIEITLIILPIVGPVILGMEFPWVERSGMDPTSRPALVWFCVLFAVTLQTSFLTPPVGFALFYVMGVAPKQVDIGDVYRGVLPFIALQLVAIALLLWFPQLVLWLPALKT